MFPFDDVIMSSGFPAQRALNKNYISMSWDVVMSLAIHFIEFQNSRWDIHMKQTRRSENDNTPQPLNQWTNSPSMGKQVGNCKSLTSADILPSTVAQEQQAHCASNIVSNAHLFHSKSQLGSNILPTRILMVSMTIHPLIPMIELFFYIWPSESKVKVIARGHIVGITSYRPTSLSFHVNRPSRSWDAAI